MPDCVDIIFVQALDCYIEIVYSTRLRHVRFIRSKENLIEKKTQKVSFELDEYFKGERTEFSCDYDISGLSAFTQKVLYETEKIRHGETITYSELAGNIGTKSARAVGQALASNPIPIVIPCHRVVAKNGIGGYSAGVEIKTRLLDLEERTRRSNNL